MPQVGCIEHQKDKYQPGRSVAVYEHRMVRQHAQHHWQGKIVIMQGPLTRS